MQIRGHFRNYPTRRGVFTTAAVSSYWDRRVPFSHSRWQSLGRSKKNPVDPV